MAGEGDVKIKRPIWAKEKGDYHKGSKGITWLILKQPNKRTTAITLRGIQRPYINAGK